MNNNKKTHVKPLITINKSEINCKEEITEKEMLMFSSVFAEKKLTQNREIKSNPFTLHLFDLLIQLENEYDEFNMALNDFLKNPSGKNKFTLLYEIGDCINQLGFIAAKICGAKKLIRK